MRLIAFGLVCSALVLVGAPAAYAAYDDVPSSHWASAAVTYVSAPARDYIRGFDTKFSPNSGLTRRVWARAMVKAFGAADAIDSTITFSDLPVTDSWYRYANVAVKRGWLSVSGGAFSPHGAVQKRHVDRSLVKALGLGAAVKGLTAIKESSGEPFKLPAYFGYMVVAGNLRLHYNHPTGSTEKYERYPWEAVSRADGAYSLWRAVQASSSWMMSSMEQYETITLPAMNDARHTAVEFAFQYVVYPYVYAGEWYRATPDGYCCGAQPHGGFDCSGFVWWATKKASSSYNNTHVRPYAGWALAERASYQMAAATTTRLKLADLRALDIVFFNSDGAGSGASGVDHAGLALGGGWMIHSSGSRAGVTLDRVGDGYWAGAFVWGRRTFTA